MQKPEGDWAVAVTHQCHAGFFLVSHDDIWLAIDPFFSDEFEWQGHTEHYKDSRKIELDDVTECDGIIITHDHGDHFDPPSVKGIMERTKAALFCPEPVVEKAVAAGVDARRIQKLDKGGPLAIGDVDIIPMPNKGSEQETPCSRFSYLFRTTRHGMIFHSGDSHGPSPEWERYIPYVDVALLWPAEIDDTIEFLEPDTVVLMHCDRFEPGDFLCNVDAHALKKELEEKHPRAEIVVPGKDEWIAVPLDSPE